MADYTYTGITTYISTAAITTESVAEIMKVIANAITPLYNHEYVQNIRLTDDLLEKYADIVSSDSYKVLGELEGMVYINKEDMPLNTPADRMHADIEDVTIKGQTMTKIYIPICAKNTDNIARLMYAWQNVLFAAFDHDIVIIKSRTANEFEEFADAKESVLYSTLNN